MTLMLNNMLDPRDTKPHLVEFSGFDIIQLLRRNSALILFMALAGAALTGFWLNRQVPVYVSSASVVLRGSDLPSDTNSSGQNQGAFSPTQFFTEVEVMSSRDFVHRIAEQLDLFDDPRYNPTLTGAVPESAISRLLASLGVESNPNGQTSANDDNDPVASENLLQRVLAYIPFPERANPRNLSEEEQRDAVVAKLHAQYVVSASDRHNVVRIQARNTDPAQASRIANTAATLYIETRANNQQRDLDRQIKFLTQRRNEIADGLARTQAKAAALIRDFRLHDTSVTQLLIAENARLENRLAAASPGAAGTEETAARITEIDRLLDDRVKAEIQLAARDLALKTETSRFDAIQQRLDELEAQRQTPSYDVSQISRAEVPLDPVDSAVGATMAIAILAFTTIGIVVAVVRENIDRRVNSQSDAESATGLEVVASLPKLPNRLLRRHGGPPGIIDSHLNSSYSNGISALVTVAMQNANPGRASVLLVGSSVAGEGKSSIASAVAVSAASDELKVLLIDFDVYRSGASKCLNIPPGHNSMTSMLRQEKGVDEFITPTAFLGLDVMNFKPRTRVSRRVLGTTSAKEVLDSVRQDYDLIIIDTPPFLASEEAGRLSGIVDKAILVSGWRLCSREALAATKHRMLRNNLTVAGVVINGINPRSALAYGYHSYLSEYYGKRHA